VRTHLTENKLNRRRSYMIFRQGKRILVLMILISSQVGIGYGGSLKITGDNTLINCFFKSLYNFSFHEADSLVLVMKDSDMDKITLTNIRANLAWWKMLSGEAIDSNTRICDSCINESIRISSISKSKDTSFLLNIIYSYSLKARLENYRGNTLKSLIYFYKSITYIEECINNPVKDEKLTLVSGLYFYFIDYIEHEYFIFNAVFFSFQKGDKNKGLSYLEECSLSDNEMIRTEANYFLMKIYGYTEKDYPKALDKVQILAGMHPNNLVYSLEQFKLLLKMKKKDEADLFQKSLVEKILATENLSSTQKNHFISQIGDLSKTRDKL
jgi:hypothetical protein